MNLQQNNLDQSSSLYLQQHQNNPVFWQMWSPEILEQAKRQNKMLLVSIGYSACHWCHVMEKECFEDQEVADLMNAHFICVKIDREERPDVDHFYMSAVQLMQQQGGWPLNCFALPDGRPIHGGTYFPKDKWMRLLSQVAKLSQEKPADLESYAEQLKHGLNQTSLLPQKDEDANIDRFAIEESIKRLVSNMDSVEGGMAGAPKFPIPIINELLLEAKLRNNIEDAENQLKVNLEKMMQGGIHDQIGGGFSRYSVDALWKVPHFEKMLYDNAQLLSNYAKSGFALKNADFTRCVEQDIAWLQREMKSKDGGYFAAMDADSEGEEGKYYVWQEHVFQEHLSMDELWVLDYFEMGNFALWENGNNIPLRRKTDDFWCEKFKISKEELWQRLDGICAKLLTERNKRIPPATDKKRLCSWNAQLWLAYLDAYITTGNQTYVEESEGLKKFFANELMTETGLLHQAIDGGQEIHGFLEDYATTIEASIKDYCVSGDSNSLKNAKALCEYVLTHFSDEQNLGFYDTAANSELPVRTRTLHDSVMPSAHSIMGHNLLSLGLLLHQPEWIDKSEKLWQSMQKDAHKFPASFANWLRLGLRFTDGHGEIRLVGKKAQEEQLVLMSKYQHKYLVHAVQDDQLKERYYLCRGTHCLAPVDSIDELEALILEN